jgi:GrpB-like predicted nucleotidyltransferase (UPF0157 family)
LTTAPSKITAYDPSWPQQYDDEVTRLAPIFAHTLVEVHHVGSTAVPGLAAKPEIDVLVVVNDCGTADVVVEPLKALGYRRGGDLSRGHAFFKRDVKGVRTHKLHVCLVGHPKIAEMLRFRDHLREHAESRIRYEELKLRLERENTRGIGEYLEGKAPFIEEVLSNLPR